MEPWNWRVALVRPRNPLNVGAAARAMANFGFRDLVVVNPYEPTWQEARSAVGAGDLVRAARAVPTLLEGVGDAALVLGTTSGSRRHLARELIPLAELPSWLETRVPPQTRRRVRRAALLFGSEKTGLSNEDLSHCHGLLRIPTSPACPSMNLGQAVAVCCYELARQGLAAGRPPGARLHRSDPASAQSLAHLFARATNILDAAGYLKPKSRHATLLKLRQLLLELGLTNYDVRVLGGVLAQIEWKLGVSDH